MKVYVIKRNDDTYFDRYFDHYIRFVDEVLFGEMFKLKGSAEEMIDFIIRNKYKFNISKEELSIEEYLLMSETELSDYTKQVRKEIYQELKNKILYCSERIFEDGHYYYGKELDEIIDQIQGEPKC